jgi:hypothetical protein
VGLNAPLYPVCLAVSTSTVGTQRQRGWVGLARSRTYGLTTSSSQPKRFDLPNVDHDRGWFCPSALPAQRPADSSRELPNTISWVPHQLKSWQSAGWI